MTARRSLLLNGLRLTLSRPRAVLWTYFFNVLFALLFALRLNSQLHDILSHSLAAQRLTAAFDLDTFSSVAERLTRNAPATGIADYLGIFLYLAVYFLIVPGALFCYQTAAPARLAILLSIGFQRFWRFFRIAGLTLLAAALILGPLSAAAGAWSHHIDETMVGWPAFYATMAGWLIVALVAAVLRLYFDLVEVYTLALGEQLRTNGRPDRRVRRVLLPAAQALAQNFGRAYLTFLFLTVLGLAAMFLCARTALHMLAQRHAWPMFLIAQLGFLLMLFTRFWQRAAETILVQDYPLPVPEHLRPIPVPVSDLPPPIPFVRPGPADPIPTTEPASPSLTGPDPGVFEV